MATSHQDETSDYLQRNRYAVRMLRILYGVTVEPYPVDDDLHAVECHNCRCAAQTYVQNTTTGDVFCDAICAYDCASEGDD